MQMNCFANNKALYPYMRLLKDHYNPTQSTFPSKLSDYFLLPPGAPEVSMMAKLLNSLLISVFLALVFICLNEWANSYYHNFFCFNTHLTATLTEKDFLCVSTMYVPRKTQGRKIH